ncbi:MAG: chromate transporter [Bacillus subtilis]|nr:chromate transporter [Bacillus subtilis]
MAELLLLFWIFFKIGLFTFGGGYAMIPLIREELVGGGFITEELLRDFIGISESTPGPFAVNMATFIGMDNAGLIGAFFATFGVVLPSFLILLLIARFGSKVLDSKPMQHAFYGLKPTVVGLITAVAVSLILSAMLPEFELVDLFGSITPNFAFDWKAAIIMVIVLVLMRTVKKASPIKMIVLSAFLGLILYGVIQ